MKRGHQGLMARLGDNQSVVPSGAVGRMLLCLKPIRKSSAMMSWRLPSAVRLGLARLILSHSDNLSRSLNTPQFAAVCGDRFRLIKGNKNPVIFAFRTELVSLLFDLKYSISRYHEVI